MNRKHVEIIIILCGLSAASVGICINSQSVFYVAVSNALNVYRGSLSMYQTIVTLTLAVFSLIVPRLLNEKNFKALVNASIVVMVLTIVFMAFAKDLIIFYILSFIRGVALSFTNIVMITIIVNGWFLSKRGLVTSVILSVAGAVGVVMAPMFTFIINNYSYNVAYIVMAIITLFFCLPFMFKKISLKAETLGYEAYGELQEVDKDENRKFSYLFLSFIAVVILSLLTTSCNGLTANMQGYALSIGKSTYTGSLMVSAVMVANIVSKLLLGTLTDKLGAYKASFIMIVLYTTGITGLCFAESEVSLIIFAFIFGFVYSITSIGVAFITREFFGENNYSKAFPVVSFAGSVGSALAISLIGYVYDFTGTYKTVFYLYVGVGIVSLLLLMFSYKKNKKEYVNRMYTIRKM